MLNNCSITIPLYRENYYTRSKKRDFFVNNCLVPPIEGCIEVQCPVGYTSNSPVKNVSEYQTFCMNDEFYCNRFIPGDILYIQYPYMVFGADLGTPLAWNTGGTWGFDIIIEDRQGNTLMSGISTFATDYGVGWSTNFDSYGEWINIDTAAINYTDFVIHLIIKDLAGTETNFWSLPYCAIDCLEENVFLTADMNTVDLDGNIFVDPTNIVGSPINYLNQVRIPAELIKNAHKIETELTNGILTKNKKAAQYLLRSHKLPEYVADKIALIMSCANIMVSYFRGDNEIIPAFQVENPDSVNKNFDEGHQWLIEMTLTKKVDELNINCNN